MFNLLRVNFCRTLTASAFNLFCCLVPIQSCRALTAENPRDNRTIQLTFHLNCEITSDCTDELSSRTTFGRLHGRYVECFGLLDLKYSLKAVRVYIQLTTTHDLRFWGIICSGLSWSNNQLGNWNVYGHGSQCTFPAYIHEALDTKLHSANQ